MSSNLSPSVNGISPREGVPGTKLTIRGENLGISFSDILHIWMNKHDVSCTVQWHSTKKLNILSSFGEGIIKIIVVTKSGGIGTCDVEYYQTVSQNVGLQDQVSYWPPNEQKNYQVLSSYSKRTQPKQINSEIVDLKDVSHGDQSAPIGFAMSDDDLSKIYKGRGSTSLTESDFNPILFLLKYHHGAGYSDLVNLLEHYRTSLANEKVKEPISIVKANLYTIFQCLECLEALKNKIDEEKTMIRPISGAFAENELCRTLEDSKNIAHQMYEEVLKRRDYADSARSALSVMQRFRFLFNLPRSIRENISKGEYSTVINEYLRARSLFGSSEIRLFQQVYKDVVDVIDKFKDMLRRQLLEMPAKCDAVKVTIRLLRQLEVDYDPTLVCLDNQRQWILQSISKLNCTSFSNVTVYKTRLDKLSGNSRKYPIVLMVEELNKLLSDQFTETLSLASYYLELESSNKDHSERESEVEDLVHSILVSYSAKIRDTLVQGSLQPGWLVYCLQHVRQAIETVSMDDLSTRSTQTLVSLLEDLRVRAVRALMAHADQDICALIFKENWTAEMNDVVGATTRLPALYRNIIVTLFSDINRIINSRHSMERPVCSGSTKDEQAFIDWLATTMKAYVICADNILLKLTTKNQDNVTVTAITDNSDHTMDPINGAINMSQYLLLMANNCHHCIVSVVPGLVDNMRVQALPGTDHILAMVIPCMEELHDRLVTAYVDMRLSLLLGPIEAAMTGSGGYNWLQVPLAIGARGYVHQILMGLAQAHCELELICPHLSRECVLRLAVKAVEEVHRVVEATGGSASGNKRAQMQLVVDMVTIDQALSALGPEKGSMQVRQLWQEATSIMNVLRGGHRFTMEEQATIKSAVDHEARTMSLLVRGFRETGQWMEVQ